MPHNRFIEENNKLEFGTLIGLVSAIIILGAVVFVGGSVRNFLNLPALFIVLGGTIASTLISFKLKDCILAVKAFPVIFKYNKESDCTQTTDIMLRFSLAVRKDGIFRIKKMKVNSDFMRKAVDLLVDGVNISFFKRTMFMEIEALKLRHQKIQQVYKKMGTLAPAFGMLGTVMGLIKMLTRLNDPSSIGPAMAVALLTTFYGSLLSTVIFLPIANKLTEITKDEIANMKIIIEGSIALMDAEHPVFVQELLSAFQRTSERKPITPKL